MMTRGTKGPRTLRDIAKELGVSVDSVRSTIRSAFRKLAKDPEALEILRAYVELGTENTRMWRRGQ